MSAEGSLSCHRIAHRPILRRRGCPALSHLYLPPVPPLRQRSQRWPAACSASTAGGSSSSLWWRYRRSCKLAAPIPFRQILLGSWQTALLVTLKLTVVSFIFILIVGMMGGLGRVSSNRIINGIASLYVEIVRGIPVLVWLLWIWFALPQVLRALRAMDRGVRAVNRRCDCRYQAGSVYRGGHRLHLCLRRVHDRGVPGRHPVHRQGADGGRTLARHELPPGDAVHHPAPGRPGDPASRQQRVRDAC